MSQTHSLPLEGLQGKLSNRAYRALVRHGFTTVNEVIEAYPSRLLKVNGFGLASLREIESIFFPGIHYKPTLKRDINKKFKDSLSPQLESYIFSMQDKLPPDI